MSVANPSHRGDLADVGIHQTSQRISPAVGARKDRDGRVERSQGQGSIDVVGAESLMNGAGADIGDHSRETFPDFALNVQIPLHYIVALRIVLNIRLPYLANTIDCCRN